MDADEFDTHRVPRAASGWTLLENYVLGWKMQFDLLAIRNNTFLQDLVYLEQVESTNSALLELTAEERLITPVMLLAQRQTAGRGRGNNRWWSAAGSLTFSVMLDFPMLSVEQLSSFSLTVGLAICQTIEKLAPAVDLSIKWPNDVYLHGKKLAGILIERPDANEPRLVVGVGVNLNNQFDGAPMEVTERATSLLTELGDPADPNVVLITCLNELERRCRDHVHQPKELLDQWQAYCHLTGRNVTVESGQYSYHGKCLGIDETGALLVASEHGTQQVVSGIVTEF